MVLSIISISQKIRNIEAQKKITEKMKSKIYLTSADCSAGSAGQERLWDGDQGPQLVQTPEDFKVNYFKGFSNSEAQGIFQSL